MSIVKIYLSIEQVAVIMTLVRRVFFSLRNKILQKRINLRIEHIQHSRCRDDFLRRVKDNEEKKRNATEKKMKVCCKRIPAQPRKGHLVRTKGKKPEDVEILPYEFVA